MSFSPFSFLSTQIRIWTSAVNLHDRKNKCWRMRTISRRERIMGKIKREKGKRERGNPYFVGGKKITASETSFERGNTWFYAEKKLVELTKCLVKCKDESEISLGVIRILFQINKMVNYNLQLFKLYLVLPNILLNLMRNNRSRHAVCVHVQLLSKILIIWDNYIL